MKTSPRILREMAYLKIIPTEKITYKNDKDIYYSSLKDYRTNEDVDINDLINKEKIDEYNNKIKELLYLKYPKYIADELNDSNTTESYIFRDSELVIYFNNYSQCYF